MPAMSPQPAGGEQKRDHARAGTKQRGSVGFGRNQCLHYQLSEHDADDFAYDPKLLLIERSIDVVERGRAPA